MVYSTSHQRVTMVVVNTLYILRYRRYSVLANESTLRHLQVSIIDSNFVGWSGVALSWNL